MRFCHFQDCLSPHMMPLMCALVARLGEGEVRYVYTQALDESRQKLGWAGCGQKPSWTLDLRAESCEARKWLEECPILMSGWRDMAVFELRARYLLPTFYSGERWFKPILLTRWRVRLPGIIRLLSPRYLRMALRMWRLMRGSAPFLYLPDGVLAARDMARLCGLMQGDMRCLFRAPQLDFERRPGGRIFLAAEAVAKPGRVRCPTAPRRREDTPHYQMRGSFATGFAVSAKSREAEAKYCLDKMRMWGYFVTPSKLSALQVEQPPDMSKTLRVLWVGRLLDLKGVDAIIRAVGADLKGADASSPNMTLDIYGVGPEEARLKRLAASFGDAIRFHPPVSIDEVRRLMRTHDVYVLGSNSFEGWGAVVSEALEEGRHVLGTYEAGSSATMLDDADLFHAGDWKRLAKLLARCLDEKRRGVLKSQGIGEWSAEKAADRLLALINEVQS